MLFRSTNILVYLRGSHREWTTGTLQKFSHHPDVLVEDPIAGIGVDINRVSSRRKGACAPFSGGAAGAWPVQPGRGGGAGKKFIHLPALLSSSLLLSSPTSQETPTPKPDYPKLRKKPHTISAIPQPFRSDSATVPHPAFRREPGHPGSRARTRPLARLEDQQNPCKIKPSRGLLRAHAAVILQGGETAHPRAKTLVWNHFLRA
jgi:hypothetical protein